MKCDGQFDDPKPGAQMAPGHRHDIDQLLPQLIGKLPQVMPREIAQ